MLIVAVLEGFRRNEDEAGWYERADEERDVDEEGDHRRLEIPRTTFAEERRPRWDLVGTPRVLRREGCTREGRHYSTREAPWKGTSN